MMKFFKKFGIFSFQVPGFNLPSQPPSSTERPPSAPEIKKEPEYSQNLPSVSPAQQPPPPEKSPALKSSGASTPGISVSQTPPLRPPGGTNSPQTSVGHSAVNLISPSSGFVPTSLSQGLHHSQIPPHYGGQMPPPHSSPIHPSFFHAMHQFHYSPYGSIPYPAYGYGIPPHPLQQQQAPISRPEVKTSIESSTTMISSQQHTTSSQLTGMYLLHLNFYSVLSMNKIIKPL